MKIAIVGGGNMGQAMVTAFLNKKIVRPADLLVVDRNEERQRFFTAKKIRTCVGTRHVLSLRGYDVIFLAVKPQDMADLLAAIRDWIGPKALVISIAAGVTIERMTGLLGRHKIVRCMPNTPAQIQQGVTGWTANQSVTVADKKRVERLLSALGAAIYFPDEAKLDAVTAVSGCGPAYVFYFMEAMTAGAKEVGFSEQQARALVLGTFMGATQLVATTGETPSTLRAKVASKKGSTAAATEYLDSNKVTSLIVEAMQKALQRAQELNI
ncbi:pyrroline-5-carboxylate reductase [Candidatus Peregrinibacteria bacterium]|nr:pyrroline-5-carboxylate reductase [Candidatus Peregrinibacteria bacterium]